MKNHYRLSLSFLLLCATRGPSFAEPPQPDKLSLDQKIGQLFMIAIDNEIAETYKPEITQGKLGGALLRWDKFDGQEALTFTQKIQALASQAPEPIPFLFAADHEGGQNFTQRRKGWTVFPGNMALGAAGLTELTEKAALTSAREVRAMGVQLVLGPVADVNNNPNNPIIGLRSYGEKTDAVEKHLVAAVKGLTRGGTLISIKHFPGHGDTGVDSHTALPTTDSDLREALRPFQAAIRAGAPAVMPAHIIASAIDPDKPVTLSKKAIDGYLREKMGFKGLVISDSMDMKGALAIYGNSPDAGVRACKDAFNAGCDLFLLGKPSREEYLALHKAFADAVNSGEISEDRLNSSVGRILAMKKSWTPPVEGASVPYDEHQALAQEIANQSVTLLKNKGSLLPLQNKDKNLLVVLSRPARLSNEADGFIKEIQTRYKNTDSLQIPPGLKDEALKKAVQEALEKAQKADMFLIGTYLAGSKPDKGQIELLTSLQASGKPIITVSMANPYDAKDYPDCQATLCTYGMTPASLKAAALLISGEIQPKGKLPVTVSNDFPIGSGLQKIGQD